MSWGAQNRSKDAKTPGVAGVRSDKPEPVSCPVQPYVGEAPKWDSGSTWFGMPNALVAGLGW
jgi:hypothetical protein